MQRLTQPDGQYLDYGYDDAHRLTDITDAKGDRTRYVLDPAGNVEQVDITNAEDALARQSRTQFDALGRPWKQRNAADNVTERQHDALGRLNKLIDAKSRTTDYRWDTLGRLKEIEDAQQPARGLTQAQYDGQDRLTSLTTPNGSSTQFTVNGLGDVTQEISPDRGTLTYTYDGAGNLTRRTDGLGRVADYTWDALNRPTSITYRPSVGATPTETVTYTWDSAAGCNLGTGRLCIVADGSGSTLYSYNDKGFLISTTRSEVSGIHITHYVRNLAGQVTSWVDPAGSQLNTPRDAGGNPVSTSVWKMSSSHGVTRSLVFDASGELTGGLFGIVSRYSLLSRIFNTDGQLTEGLLVQPVAWMKVNWNQPYAFEGAALRIEGRLQI